MGEKRDIDMAKKKEVIVEKPNYLELAISFNSDELLAFYLKKIKEESAQNAKNAYNLRENQAARIAALEAEKAKLESLWKRDSQHLLELGEQKAKMIEALELVADNDYTSVKQLKDIARRVLAEVTK